MTPWLGNIAAPDRSIQQRRAHALERSAGYIRLVIAVVAVPLVLVFEKDHRLELTALLVGLALFSLIAAYFARVFPDSFVAANIGWPVAAAVAMAAVAITGGASSPLWIVLIFPILGAVARFRGWVSGLAVTLTCAGGIVIIVTTPGISFEDGMMLGFTLSVVGLSLWLFGDRDVKIHEEAVLDPLTELFNRHHLNGRIQELDITLERAGGKVSVIAADLDFFKSVNDEYGHARGDAVLRDVAYVLRENIRSSDVAFRAGGEEFVLILPGADPQTARSIAERVREAVAENRPGDLYITISCGVASASDEDGIEMKSLLECADIALYEAKRGGRNRVCIADISTSAGSPESGKPGQAKPDLRAVS